MKRDEMIQWLSSRGYVKSNRSDKIYAKVGNKERRYVLSAIAVRLEVKAGSGWVRVHSNYLKHLTINDKNQLSIGGDI